MTKRPLVPRKSVFGFPVDQAFLTSFPDRGPLPDAFEDATPEEEEEAPTFMASFDREILPMLDRIPKTEADIIELIYRHRKTQVEIAEIFGMTQEGISYRLQRGLGRLHWLRSLPSFTESDLRRDLPTFGIEPRDVEILVGMWETTCQSETANRLGLIQGQVRQRFYKLCPRLASLGKDLPAAVPYSVYFEAVKKRPGALWFATIRRYKTCEKSV